MATMLNVLPAEIKPTTVPQSTSKKGSTSENSTSGFAKVLNNQTDKNETDVTPNPKEDNTNQLMAAMASAILPFSVSVPLPDQELDSATASLLADATTVQLVSPVQVDTKNQLQNLVQVDTKEQLPEVATEGKVELDSTLGMNTSPNQLAALLSKMTDTSVDSKTINDFAQLQLQVQVTTPLQDEQIVEQVQQTIISEKNADNLTDNTALLATAPSIAVMDTSNGTGISGKPTNNKKSVADQGKLDTTKITDLAELVGTVDVEPLTAPQTVVSVVEAVTNDEQFNGLVLGGKEQVKAEPLLSDQSVKSTDMFANLLNQQTLKTDGQVNVSEVKQSSQKPVADPYNIASQIVDQARLVEGTKNTEMIIKLKPEHLGELTFKVTVENGVVNASFHSNNSEVRNMIESSLQQLKQDMSQQGLKVDNVSVYAGLGQFLSDGQRESQPKAQVKVKNKKTEEDFFEALDLTNSVESVSEGSGVDYRV